MHCRPFLGGFVCGGRTRLPNCSTPGCSKRGELSCDHPVERSKRPKVGDTRVHRERKVVFYLVAMTGDELTVSTKPYGGPGHHISLADWLTKSDATCDRPVCAACSTHIGTLDYCAAHARALENKNP